jgi:phosphatidyl-myo-inositol dimannoside synthase
VSLLLLTEVFPPRVGGSGRWLWELYRRLPDLDVFVAAGETTGSAAFDARSPLATTRLPLYFSNWGLWSAAGATHYARASLGLFRLVFSRRPDVIHCGKSLPEGLLALWVRRTLGIPYCCYAHGEELTLAETTRELRRLNARVLAGAAKVFANSHHTGQLLTDEWAVPHDRVVVMHPGVDTTRFVPAPPNDAIRQELGWLGRRVVLTVGALQKRKGQDTMIRALPAIAARIPDTLYVVVGEGWERPYLDELVTSLGVSHLVQFRGVPADDELVRIYQQCDLFVLPNRKVGWDFEGFGIVLLEAQACGKAVIAGRSGGTMDAVDESRTGDIVQCDSPEPLAEAVCRLLEDDDRREAFGQAGRSRAVEKFDWNVLAGEARERFVCA